MIGPCTSPSFVVAGTNVARARCQREPTNAANRSAMSFSIVLGTLIFVIPVQLMLGFACFLLILTVASSRQFSTKRRDD